ncbi:hypothetical protein P22_1428 [Propionispora sp. 2/2-37]|uniref:flagellar filament capping protein FliD n=1 Tax=Propionispora sp. 2/2-37 TaxID=1677858 RepID=UPI0006BB6EFF|nr:flagellar filament capping protein FliD [Propionispora sp. 2/2-37]CUH95358.1 hypothetical protein P22_1428 [Propionispora sp. 2/2-37]
MSTSSSGVSSSTVNGTTRVTGMSGFNVDSVVEQLMTAEKAKKLNKLEQKEQLAEWKQEAYRDIITDVQDFYNKYFYGSSDTSLLTAKNFNKFTVNSSSKAVSAAYNSSASAGSHKVFVSKLAKAATRTSGAVTGDVKGNSALDYAKLGGESFNITVDGTDYTVSFDANAFSSCAGLSDAQTIIQTTIDKAVGSNKLKVGVTGPGIVSITADDTGVNKISISAAASDSAASALTALGFGTGSTTSNRLNISTATLKDIAAATGLKFDTDGGLDFTINGVNFSFDQDDSASDVINQINKKNCGATLAYDEISNTLVLKAKATGAGNRLAVSDTNGTFCSSILKNYTEGQDAQLTVDGVALTRSSNTVDYNGVTYTLNDVTDTDGDGEVKAGEYATISGTLDVDSVYNLISGFVKDYNALIGTINTALSENYDSDYPPLTDDQKEDMSDEEIKNWEAKAKTGLLEDDPTLRSFLTEIRLTMLDSISGLDTSIFDIGLDTTDTYKEGGKLVIESEDKLKSAITNNLTDVINLFTQKSTDYPGVGQQWRNLNADQLKTRYKQEGLAYRFYDVIGKYTTTLNNSKGYKGIFAEKVGLEGSTTENDNELSDNIDKYKKAISEEEDRLDDYEDSLYIKYSKLESYLSQMNTQLAALQSYLSSSS